MNDMTKTQWVHVQINDVTYETLMMVATNMGLHASQAAAQLLESAIAEYIDENFKMPGARIVMNEDDRILAPIYRAFYTHKRREQAANMLSVIAARIQRAPSEESVIELRQMCEALGLDFQEIMDKSTNEVVAAVAEESNAKLALAKQFIVQNMEPNKEYKMKDIQRLMDDQGISLSYQRKLKHDLAIKSIRRGEYWVWIREV